MVDSISLDVKMPVLNESNQKKQGTPGPATTPVSSPQARVGSPQLAPLNRDRVVISNNNKANVKHSTASTLQIVALLSGTVASAAIVYSLLKPNLLGNKLKPLFKQIDDFVGPKYVKDKLIAQAKRLKMPVSEAEFGVINNYIDNVQRMPWQKTERKIVDPVLARKILDDELIGMDKVKDQIITYIEVQNHKIQKGIIDDNPLVLLLDGPPGTGKTSIAEAAAKAMGRPFKKVGLEGISDAHSINGIKGYYVGAEPGAIINAVQSTKASNSVILLDEIDKLTKNGQNGDPYAALISVLEPKQCKTFTDNYIGLPYDLSDTIFMIASNDLNKVPSVLKNRVKIINVEPYTAEIKTKICEREMPKIMEELGIDESKVKFHASAINEIVSRANDFGARKTLENLRSVLNEVICQLRKNDYKKDILVDSKLVKNALRFSETS